jgi:hypothetical protein
MISPWGEIGGKGGFCGSASRCDLWSGFAFLPGNDWVGKGPDQYQWLNYAATVGLRQLGFWHINWCLTPISADYRSKEINFHLNEPY